MTAYTDARQDVADAITVGMGDDWVVSSYPPERIGTKTIAVAIRDAEASGSCRWRRNLMVAVMDRRHATAESHDSMDRTTVELRQILEAVPGCIYMRALTPSTMEVGGTEYWIQMHEITIETDN
jgi:hypothetical protein